MLGNERVAGACMGVPMATTLLARELASGVAGMAPHSVSPDSISSLSTSRLFAEEGKQIPFRVWSWDFAMGLEMILRRAISLLWYAVAATNVASSMGKLCVLERKGERC